MSTRYSVFISSTYLDNATRRKLVEDAVINAGMVPIGMERFTASTRPTVEECVRLGREADVLVGIIARRYGWVPDGHELSITELEYGAACERLMFLLDDDVAVDEADEGPLKTRLQQFKTRIASDQTPGRFTDVTLQLQVYRALVAWRDVREARSTRSPDAHREPPPYDGAHFARRVYPNEVEALGRFHTDVFVGRDDVLGEISEFAAREQGGYMLVTGGAGFGKTALIFESLRRHGESATRAGPRPDVVFYFVGGGTRENSPEEFLSAVNSQLLDLLHQAGGVAPEFSARRAQFQALWERAAARARPDRPLLLLVDGLDEWQPGPTTYASLLPATLGAYAHIVCTSLPVPEPARVAGIAHGLRSAKVRRLSELREQDINALLLASGIPEPRAATLAPRVLALTEGVPLYARFVCGDIVAGGEQRLDSLQRHPPDGVREYFAQELRQLVARASLHSRLREALGLLLVARGPMTLDEIASVFDCPLWELRDHVESVSRFLIGDPRLRLVHKELIRALESWFSLRERTAFKAQLARWCSAFADRGWPDDTPEYILSYYPEHLFEVGDFESLHRLVESRWIVVARRTLGSHATVLRAIELALEAARAHHPAFLDRELRCILASAVVRSISGATPLDAISALAWVGRVPAALSHAEMLFGSLSRAEAYQDIAEALEAQQRHREARSSLSAALLAIQEVMPNYVLFEPLKALSTALARVGDYGGLQRAVDFAGTLSGHFHTYALCGVALGFAALPDGAKRAVSLARKALMDYEPVYGRGLMCALEVAVAAEDVDFLRELRQRLDPWHGFRFEEVAAAYAVACSRARLDDEAKEYAERALTAALDMSCSRLNRSQRLSACSSVLGRVGALHKEAREAALLALESVTEAAGELEGTWELRWTRRSAISAWTGVASAPELVPMYESLATGREDDEQIARPFAVAFARTGQMDRALAAVKHLAPRYRDQALQEVSVACCDMKDLDNARMAAELINDPRLRAFSFAAIALSFAKGGRSSESEQMARRAIDEADRPRLSLRMLDAFVDAGKALCDVGDEPRGRLIATAAIRQVTPAVSRHTVYDGLLPAIDAALEAGAFEDALALAMHISGRAGSVGPDGKLVIQCQAQVLEIAARALWRAGDVARARTAVTRLKSLADTIGPHSESVTEGELTTLMILARTFIDTGDTRKATPIVARVRRLALTPRDGGLRIATLSALPGLLAAFGKPKLALKTSRTLLVELEKLEQQLSLESVLVGTAPNERLAWQYELGLQYKRATVATVVDNIGLKEQGRSVARRVLDDACARPEIFGGTREGPFVSAVALLGEEALAGLTRLADGVKRRGKPHQRAKALGLVACAFDRIGHSDAALEHLRDAFEAARSNYPEETFELFGGGASILARNERGDLLQVAYEGVENLRSTLASQGQVSSPNVS